jgi:hypothetical protein
MSLIGRFAVKVGLRERRRDARVATRGVEAFYATGGERKDAAIKDISPAGICLATKERLQPGSPVLLTLRRRALEEADYGTHVSMPSRVVRANGMEAGLEFVHEYIDAAGWSQLVLQAAQLSSRNDGVRVFRIARALAFLRRISPAGADHFLEAITGGMSYDGEERALEMVLQAEEMLASRKQVPKTGVDPDLIRRIVDRGVNLDTWETDVMQCWAGLLASSCLKDSDDRESLSYAELLSKLEQGPIRILTAGCVMAMAVGWDAGFVFPHNIQCDVDAMKKIVGVRNTMAVDWGLNRLHELGLLQQTLKPPMFDPAMQMDITPTGLGLKLYVRCTGRLELPEACVAGSGNGAAPRPRRVGVS